jgi:hypothetical protein
VYERAAAPGPAGREKAGHGLSFTRSLAGLACCACDIGPRAHNARCFARGRAGPIRSLRWATEGHQAPTATVTAQDSARLLARGPGHEDPCPN